MIDQTTSKKLGNFAIDSELGHGALATVYRATSRLNQQLVAVKVIDKTRLPMHELDAAPRLEREAKLGMALRHPNIVSVYEYGEIDKHFYMAMELVDGCDLAALLRCRSLKPDEAVLFMTKLLSALHFAHCNNVTHRDVKPANILISREGVVKLMDFGIAYVANSELTHTGMILGTPAYMAPEQLTSRRVDARTDVFAAGAILYHMMTGQTPFRGSVPSVMYKVLFETPVFVPEHKVPASFVDIICRAMAKEPDQRYRSALEFRNAIEEAWQLEQGRSRDGKEEVGSNSSRMRPENKEPAQLPDEKKSQKTLSDSCRNLILSLCETLPGRLVSSGSQKDVVSGGSVGRAPGSGVLRPGDAFKDLHQPWCPTLVVLPPGKFRMGSTAQERVRALRMGTPRERVDREWPDHLVSIERPFAVGCFAATFDEWDAWVQLRGSQERLPDDRGWGRGRRPVVNVSWNGVQKHLAWLAAETGKPYRLLSEAEWEYACRAGTDSAFAFGEDLTFKQANFDDSLRAGDSQPEAFRRMTVPVDRFEPNAFGIYQMHGNISEWVEDAWHETYEGAPCDGSAWTGGSDTRRVLRGGSWNLDSGSNRAACRLRNYPNARYGSIGFRVGRSLLQHEMSS